MSLPHPLLETSRVDGVVALRKLASSLLWPVVCDNSFGCLLPHFPPPEGGLALTSKPPLVSMLSTWDSTEAFMNEKGLEGEGAGRVKSFGDNIPLSQ